MERNRHLALAVGIAAALAGCFPDAPDRETRDTFARSDTGPLPPAIDSLADALGLAFSHAARRAMPAVVYVQTLGGAPARAGDAMPPWLQEGSGSGFVFRADGYIITNNHVVESASRVTVVLQDRREFLARVVGRDPNTDVAVLQIDATDLPTLLAGDSDSLEVGDWVVALGYPLQLGSTATAGIVSATGRNLRILGDNADASAPLENFIQTDAAINVGNSGGPLVDLDGRVVGVNSAIASPTGFYSGYGFAIPSRLAFRVAADLIRYGEVHRPRLGVAVEDVIPADAEVYGLDCVCGAEVISITEGTPAADAGIQLGDVIVSMDGETIERSGELLERLALLEPGGSVQLRLFRAGRSVDLSVELGQFDPPVPATREPRPAPVAGLGRLGFAAAELGSQVARQLGLSEGGVVVSAVDPLHPASRTRLREGVLLESINGRPIRTIEDVRASAEQLRPDAVVSLIVRGVDGSRTIINYRVGS